MNSDKIIQFKLPLSEAVIIGKDKRTFPEQRNIFEVCCLILTDVTVF